MAFREPTTDETRLLRELAEIAAIESVDSWLRTLRVRNMDDGGMGSLEFELPSEDEFCVGGATVCRAAVQFKDADGVEVIASLNVREDGVPFELDVWKTDFSKLIQIPAEFRQLQ